MMGGKEDTMPVRELVDFLESNGSNPSNFGIGGLVKTVTEKGFFVDNVTYTSNLGIYPHLFCAVAGRMQ